MKDWQEIATQATERAQALGLEVAELRRLLEGDGAEAQSYLQRRVDRQRQALDRLNRKVLTQRFRLNLLRELGRDVSVEEYVAARDRIGNDRIGEYEILV